MTIFAARRVLPPDLMTPAKESKPFRKETGPEAVPPPESFSLLARRLEKLVPVPDPYLKSIPSVLARSRIASMLSETLLMKQAEHWGRGSTPTLNHTGELNAIFWWTKRCKSSLWKISASSSAAK